MSRGRIVGLLSVLAGLISISLSLFIAFAADFAATAETLAVPTLLLAAIALVAGLLARFVLGKDNLGVAGLGLALSAVVTLFTGLPAS